jgi:glycosyltransferase involved in cell wall biosynthesis
MEGASQIPRVTAIVAARNAASTLARCLDALLAQSYGSEVIVVDDCSTDETCEIAARYPVSLIKQPRHLGVSAARNLGARAAHAPVLFFLDADVVIHRGGLERALVTMSRPEIGAVIGSYDADPADPSIVSQFKNLTHHYFHQRSNAEATTFWGACGMIRRECFLAVGGFDEKRFTLPSVEDVELGYRLVRQGTRIVLDRDLQVKHLKRWTLWSLIATDVSRRAVPWTLLWLEHRQLPSDLNFSIDQRLAAIVSITGLMATLLAVLEPRVWIVVLALAGAAFWLNRGLYRLLFTKGGLRLAISGFFLQQLFYLYSLAGLSLGLVIHFAARFRSAEVCDLRES